MKYFILMMEKSCLYVPKLKDMRLYKDLTDAMYSEGAFMKLPQRLITRVTTSEQTLWADVLVSPVFLISKKVLDLVKMYGDTCYCKAVILLDQENAKSKEYYIPKFEQVKGNIVLGKIEGSESFNIALDSDSKINKWSNIFQIRLKKELYTVINLDFAESLLRRDLEGVGLKEIVISGF